MNRGRLLFMLDAVVSETTVDYSAEDVRALLRCGAMQIGGLNLHVLCGEA